MKLKIEKLYELLDTAVEAGKLKEINYRRDVDAFARDVLHHTTEKLTKSQRNKLAEFAKFML